MDLAPYSVTPLLIACKLIVGTSTLGFSTRPVTTSSSQCHSNTACKPPQHHTKISLQHQCKFRPNASHKQQRQLGHYSNGGYNLDNYAPTTVRTTMGMASKCYDALDIPLMKCEEL
ncbi:hypothetical protein H4582DRAFT_2060811 [Lactarius indigo]|nr:hypothetical protein H4582DRAFT_2060811 [Lactarius indigo]